MKTILILITLILSSCQSIVSISQSDMEVKKGREITVAESELGWLNLITPMQISVKEKLAAKCPGGTVSGVETMLLKRDFLFVQIYDLSAQASCQEPMAKAKSSTTVR